ncbi:hypothetical protein L3X38_030951 [Prunus dulcis]|uniref:Reverse transcriptase Ty1/copia-type domain-containing protein n=1 Tax=Prunus dulcis TaxID=3755 RepID=A0AAD4YUH9_PRUDU|nr:hypothetical protein L3X38_030951 [Prunus dulcis]
MPTAVLHNKSPFEMLFGTSPTLAHLRIFGCAYFPLLKPYNSTKLQAKTTNFSKFSAHIAAPIPTSPQIPVAPDIRSSSGSETHDFTPDTLEVVLSIHPLNLYPMQTRSKSGIIKKKALLASVQDFGGTDISLVQPVSYKSAIKVLVWLQAMKEEVYALHPQGTWNLVQLPANKNLVGCKWIFKIKRHSYRSIARHKARLVAKGFSQEPGLNYGETFSPVVKPTIVRSNSSHLVCKPNKPLYGLKQAPRAWNDRFTQFLPSLGFENTYSDSSLFVKHFGHEIVVLLLYVDDIIITGSASGAITQVISALTIEFDIKDLGLLHYFLGIQITKTATGLFLSQTKYVVDLLVKFEMFETKPCDTPYLPYNRLLKEDGEPYSNPKLNRSIVGALQYLTFTRLDIAFSVHQVC